MTMVFINWIVRWPSSWFFMIFALSSALTAVIGACPRDVSTKANSCFTSYSFHFQNMQNSPNRLCCGVDVEILRAFCQSYKSAISCVDQLKRDCPEDTYHAIDKSLNNLSDVRGELNELCSDDNIIETYAMYQSCFTQEGSTTERCLQIHLNSSAGTNIKFLSKVAMKEIDGFCEEMRKTVECVQRNLEMACGEDAAHLVHVMIKSMIRQSTDCDYSVIHDKGKITTRSMNVKSAFITADQKSSNGINNGSNKSDPRMMFFTVVTASLSSLFNWPDISHVH